MAIVDGKDLSRLDLSSEMSYYHGVEGGESWSEGSRDDTSYFKIKKAGSYKLLLKGQAGRGEGPGKIANAPPVHIKVYEDVSMPHFYVIATLLCGLIAIIHLGLYISFGSRRWKHLTED